ASCWTKPAVVTGAGLRPDQSGKPFGNQDLSRRLSRDNRSVAAHRCDLKQGSGNIHKSTQMSKRIPQDARTAQRTYGGRIYNAQAVVDSAEQIIVAAETTNAANDKEQAVPMAQAALDNLNAAGIEQPKAADGTPTPIPNTADTGYFSKEAVEELEKMGIDPHIATGRQKHHEAPVPPEAAAPSAEAAGLTHHFFRAYAPLFPAFLRVYHGN